MDLFGGYGSDSDGEQPSRQSAQPAPVQQKIIPTVSKVTHPARPVTSVSTSSTVNGKKVKRLDISFLPAEIQAALARGDSTRDSDDDESTPSASIGRSQINKTADRNIDAASSKLLGMLPAPKVPDSANESSTLPLAKNKVVVENSELAAPPMVASKDKEVPAAKTVPPKSAFSFGYSSTETTRTGQGKDGNVTVTVESSEAPVMPWFQDVSKPIAEVHRTPAFATAQPHTFSSGLQYGASSHHGSNHIGATVEYPASSTSSSSQQAQPARQSYEEYMKQTAAYGAQQQQADFDPPNQKKRKDRNFELQLMSGDLSGMETATVKDISVQNRWDELKYTEQQQRELEVQRGFGIGVNKNLMQVTKQQSRKHQLSSLAIKAAETELAMLEKRGTRNLTKSETQGKYGW